jgi:hypothetical protein
MSTLDYAPHPVPLLRRRRVRVAIGAAAIVLTLGWLAASFGRALLDNVDYWRLQRACLRYTAPSDRVVFTTRSAEANALARQGGGFHGFYLPGRFDIAGYEPPELRHLFGFSGMVILGDPGRNVAFLHERTSPNGHRRLIILCADGTAAGRTMGLWSTVLEPVSVLSSRRHQYSAVFAELFHDVTGDFRVFAGQPDPNDLSHFTIGYELAGTPGIIDGWLEDSGDVRLKERK